MSLGTSAWPVNRPRLVDLIINSLLEIEPPLPFVFVKGSNDLPHGLGENMETSARGLVVDWAPQMRVLKHVATGMFLVKSRSHA